ncbi:hypothetical protein QCA50_009628 [Cerrena zonata]|uniref:Uncharacterized protein n=1 Tax=Cerrena zonata TaxID=2478898 RepID=A0AAW0G7K8_9APHY
MGCAQSPGRIQSSKTKLMDPEILQGLNAHRLLEPEPLRGGLTNLIVGSLDTNGETNESARVLLKIVGLPMVDLSRDVEAEQPI